MTREIMVFAEQEDGAIHPISYELLWKGREIADRQRVELACILLGYAIENREIDELINHGADVVFVFDHESLREFDPVRYKENIVKIVRKEKPDTLLIGATNLGRSLGPRIAASLRTGLTADCIDLNLIENDLIQIRPAFTGTILANIKTSTRPQICTVRYKAFREGERNPARKGRIIREEAVIVENTGLRIVCKEALGGVDLPNAEVIVSGGRGLKKPEDFSLLKELADLYGGSCGSSRPLVDDGWISKEHQVGFTGNIVKPKLYIACGISGSPQHLAGMRNSGVIIAINNDPSAPIFKVADYGIVGDLYEVVPKLIEETKRRRKMEQTKSI